MPTSSISSGLPSTPAGLSDKDAALVMPLYRAINSLAQQLAAQSGSVQYTAAEQADVSQFTKFTSQRTRKLFVQAAEDLAFGMLVSLSVSGGKIVAHKADALTLTRPAHAIVDVPTGIATGQFGETIFMQGLSTGVTGTSFGTAYYLSTAGAVQSSMPTATGVLTQLVGIGLGSAGFYFAAEVSGRRVVRAYKFSAAVLRVVYTDGTYDDLAV